MSSRFTITGLAEVERRLIQEVRDIHSRAVPAVREEAEQILENTHPPIVTGALDASGRVETSENGNEITSSVVYGGDSAPYAGYVHEIPGQRGHKFLERPFVEAGRGMAGRLAKRIKK